MKHLPLHTKIIIGLAAGIIYAFISSALGWNEFTINWIDPFGTIFIRLLKFIAVPLVLFSIISGISGLRNVSKLGKMGGKTLGFYLITTILAVGVGLTMVNLIRPGTRPDEDQRIKNRISYELWAKNEGIEVKDNKSFLTDSRYAAIVKEVSGGEPQINNDRVEMMKKNAASNKEAPPLQFIVDMVPENLVLSISNNSLMLQVIFFAIFFGVSIAALPNEKTKPVVDFIKSVNDIFLKMVDSVMKAAPYFVFALLAGVIAKMADSPGEVLEIFVGLGSYSVTMFVALAFMVFVFYPVIISFLVKGMNYKKFFRNMSPAQLMAFSTSSSAATLPVTMECVEESMGVSKNITSFVLPIGATVNMDGTSIMQAVAVLFMAQLHMVDLTLTQQLTIVFTATLASIGAAAVPSAGLVMMIIVLQSVGLNP
ncbi:MAG: dicarboxylate/amino acid:cation symporter, partial [Ekhidna sp.]|nr:dicarboxylate/amino acid:cation symporter [Ekhidna sp.]